MEERLQSIWAHVLNLPHVALDQPFLAVGGDSISAMQVVGQCRKDGIGLGVQEVLRSRSIVQLAQAVTEVQHTSYETVEYFDEEFDLTPIQSLFFQRPNQGRGHFNQSFYLQVKKRTEPEEFRSAVQQLVTRHSMLRARFSHSDDLGWQQRLTSTCNPRENHESLSQINSRLTARCGFQYFWDEAILTHVRRYQRQLSISLL
jgi:aryl carrier-like protein